MNIHNSIRNKLLLVILLTTFCALFVAGGIILYYDINAYRASRETDARTQVELLAFSTAPALQFGDTQAAQENLNLFQVRTTVRAAAIYTSRGDFFAGYVRAGTEHGFPDLPGEEGITIDGSTITAYKRIIENGDILGTAYIQSDFRLTERIMDFVGILAIVAGLSMLVAILISFWLQSMITRPILSIARIARDVISKKDYSQRALKMSDDEVGVLVNDFNNMLEEIEARTRELEESNRVLEREVAERKHAREEILRLNEELEQKVQERTQQLEVTNKELESFCYSVSHDLRGPLRSINGFSQALIEDLPSDLPEEPKRYLDKILAATQRMGQLIEDLLNLSRVSRGELVRQDIDFSQLAEEVIRDLQARDPSYKVDISIWDGIMVKGDPKLLRIVLENLLGNAWKFSSKKPNPRVEVGAMVDGKLEVLYVRDNGAGFDMAYADKLFGAFQRLHGINEFPGTGIGLATVQRIIHRHGGRVWFNSSPGNGAVFYFTLKPDLHREDSRQDSGSRADSPESGKKRRLRSV